MNAMRPADVINRMPVSVIALGIAVLLLAALWLAFAGLYLVLGQSRLLDYATISFIAMFITLVVYLANALRVGIIGR